jgi:hypothetical protein
MRVPEGKIPASEAAIREDIGWPQERDQVAAADRQEAVRQKKDLPEEASSR